MKSRTRINGTVASETQQFLAELVAGAMGGVPLVRRRHQRDLWIAGLLAFAAGVTLAYYALTPEPLARPAEGAEAQTTWPSKQDSGKSQGAKNQAKKHPPIRAVPDDGLQVQTQ